MESTTFLFDRNQEEAPKHGSKKLINKQRKWLIMKRFVCNFRALNDVTKNNSYPLPHIRDLIDKMEGSKYWTTLDAASAYCSMP